MAYSQTYKDNLQANNDFVLVFLTIEIGGVVIKLVNDNVDHPPFQRCSFTINKPVDNDNIPSTSITIDNVRADLGPLLTNLGPTDYGTITFEQRLVSDPSTTQYSVKMELTDITLTRTSITGNVGLGRALQQPAFDMTYDKNTAPAML